MCNNIVRVILLTLITYTSTLTIVQQCDNVNFPLEVDIEDCDEEPCKFVIGSNVRMNLTFVAPHDLNDFSREILLTIEPLSINIPLSTTNGCKSLIIGKCPIKRGEIVTYQIVMPILKTYPKVDLSIQFTLKDEAGNGFACFKMDASVN